MILNENEAGAVIQSSKKFETSGFKIAASAKAFKILSDSLYTNKIRAIIRELSCNALDSHKAAGNTAPFEVQLPGKLLPEFSVRDFGTGMTDDVVMDLYTTYFSSTKTDSNDYVGALGLGSKTPFSYTDSFTVVSWVPNPSSTDGGTIKTVFAAYLDPYGAPSISMLSKHETNEPVGVMVQVQVNPDDIREWELEAKYVLSTFENKPNVIGAAIDYTKSETLITAADYEIIQFSYSSQYRGSIYFLMGNIPYPVPDNILQQSNYRNISRYAKHNRVIMIKVPIGTLEIAPSREALSITPASSVAIKNLLEQVDSNLYVAIINSIKSKNLSPRKAYRELRSYDLEDNEKSYKDLGLAGYRNMIGKFMSDNEVIKYQYVRYSSTSTERTNSGYSSVFKMNNQSVVILHCDVPIKYKSDVYKEIHSGAIMIYDTPECEKLLYRIRKSFATDEITEQRLSEIVNKIAEKRKKDAANKPPRKPSTRKPYEMVTSKGIEKVDYKSKEVSDYSGVYFLRSVGHGLTDSTVQQMIRMVMAVEPDTKILSITSCMSKYLNKQNTISLEAKYQDLVEKYKRDITFNMFHCRDYIMKNITTKYNRVFTKLMEYGIDIFAVMGHDCSYEMTQFDSDFIRDSRYTFRSNLSDKINEYLIVKINEKFPLIELIIGALRNTNNDLDYVVKHYFPELISHIKRIHSESHMPVPMASHYQPVRLYLPVMASHYQPLLPPPSKNRKR